MKPYLVITKEIVIELIVIWVVGLVSMILLMTGTVSPFIECFAVDDQNRLYVGTISEIQVYDKDKHIKSISPQTSKSYMFTISDDNTILLSTANTVYSMDLDGNILSTSDDNATDIYNQIQYKKYKYTASNGNTYKLVSPFGFSRIVKNGSEVVYHISVFSFVIKILLYLTFLGVFFIIISNVLKQNKKISSRKTGDGSLS